MNDRQIDDATLEREIVDAVRDVAGKRAIMNGWDGEFKDRSRRRKIVAWSMLAASCAAALVVFFYDNGFRKPEKSSYS